MAMLMKFWKMAVMAWLNRKKKSWNHFSARKTCNYMTDAMEVNIETFWTRLWLWGGVCSILSVFTIHILMHNISWWWEYRERYIDLHIMIVVGGRRLWWYDNIEIMIVMKTANDSFPGPILTEWRQRKVWKWKRNAHPTLLPSSARLSLPLSSSTWTLVSSAVSLSRQGSSLLSLSFLPSSNTFLLL